MGFILDGLSQVDVETRESEVVQLRGERGRGVSSSLSEDDATAARWAAKAIRTIESVKTVVLYHDGKTILREGVLGSSRDVDAGSPTFSAALRASVETYAPDLQAVPARVDFGCLPKNAQSALIQPFSNGGVVVACDRKRALLSPRDVANTRRRAAARGAALVTERCMYVRTRRWRSRGYAAILSLRRSGAAPERRMAAHCCLAAH